MITLWKRLNSSTGMAVGNEEEYRIELTGISSGYILKTDNIHNCSYQMQKLRNVFETAHHISKLKVILYMG